MLRSSKGPSFIPASAWALALPSPQGKEEGQAAWTHTCCIWGKGKGACLDALVAGSSPVLPGQHPSMGVPSSLQPGKSWEAAGKMPGPCPAEQLSLEGQ